MFYHASLQAVDGSDPLKFNNVHDHDDVWMSGRVLTALTWPGATEKDAKTLGQRRDPPPNLDVFVTGFLRS